MIKNIFGHLKTVLVHKWWVFYYCCKFGIPHRGIFHDMSKFSPTEFWESVKYYSGTRSPIDASKEVNGWSKAWLHHRQHNLHHYEVWTDNYDTHIVSIEMPYKYAVEMFADYIGAAKAYLGKDFTWEKELKWWLCKKDVAKSMNVNTKLFIDNCFIYCTEYNRCPNKKILKSIWSSIH